MNRSYRLYLILGGLMVAAVLFVALFADHLTPVSPYYLDQSSSALAAPPPYPPSAAHPLGTDDQGRDVWSRVAYGARWSLLFAGLIAGGRLLLAIPMAGLGVISPRVAGRLVSRLHLYTSAVPPLILYLFLLGGPIPPAVGFLPTWVLNVTILTLVEWPRLAVTLMGRLEELHNEPFVEGAVAVGASPWRVFSAHLLPHLWPTLINLAVTEIGRALLVIAQLGVFGVFFGGGVVILAGEGVAVISGIPEWGTMLANSRTFISRAPWMPLAPAFAFLFAVTGFNVLAQGAEGLTLSLGRFRAATTGRLSKGWRWAVAAGAAAAVIWFYGGLPWGRLPGIQALADAQTRALALGSLSGYLATMGPAPTSYREGEQRWADALLSAGMPVRVYPAKIRVFGHEAEVLWGVALDSGGEQPLTIVRPVRLVRRWGRWYAAGPWLPASRGFYTDVLAPLDPTDDSLEAAQTRNAVTYLSTSLDHAWAKVAPLLPAAAREVRPQVELYNAEGAFEAGLVAAGDPGASVREAAFASVPDKPPANTTGWYMSRDPATGTLVRVDTYGPPAPKIPTSISYRPGGPIRVSPRLNDEWGLDRQRTERLLGELLLDYAATERTPDAKGVALATGIFELNDRGLDPYPLDLEHLDHASFYTLPELLDAHLGQLNRTQQAAYITQSALLAEYLKQRLSEPEILALAWTPQPMDAVAQALGMTQSELTAAYDDYLLRRVAATSILADTLGRGRVPAALTEAIAARTVAAEKGDEVAFVAAAAQQSRGHQVELFGSLRQAGLRRYSATVLDIEGDDRPDYAPLYLLERLEFADGREATKIVEQTWVVEGGRWVVADADSRL